MKDYWKKKGKLLIIACIAVIAGCIVMGAYAGIHYIKAGDNKGKIEIGNENVLIKGHIKRIYFGILFKSTYKNTQTEYIWCL